MCGLGDSSDHLRDCYTDMSILSSYYQDTHKKQAAGLGKSVTQVQCKAETEVS